MINLKSPVERPAWTGFTVNEVTDSFIGKYINATITRHFADGSSSQRSFTLWMDRPETEETPEQLDYTNIGQWTDEQVEKRVAELLGGSVD